CLPSIRRRCLPTSVLHGAAATAPDPLSLHDALPICGYAVLQVNFRGSGGRGERSMQSGWKEWGGKIQDDIADGVRWAIAQGLVEDRKSTRLNSSHVKISYAVFCLKKKKDGAIRTVMT